MKKIASKILVPFRKKEHGTYVDMMAGVVMMVCIFALILVMAAYGSMVEKRLAINNAAKNYLYIAEQQGGLTQADKDMLTSILHDYGCVVEEIKVNGTDDVIARGNGKQVPYGDKITVSIKVSFTNPVYAVVGLTDAQAADSTKTWWFRTNLISPTVSYTTILSSTSRW